MTKTKVELKDGWTTNEDYQKLYQADKEVHDILDLLDLDCSKALLDNACGNGEISIQAAIKYPGLKIFGYDALEEAISEARRRAAQLEVGDLNFQVAWADNLPLTTNSVDRGLFRSALHHINDPCAVFSEFDRCLIPGGLLVLQTPFNFWDGSFSEFLSEFHLLMDDSHRRYYHTLDRIRSDLTKCGFSITSESPSTYSFPFVTKRMKEFIEDNNFVDRLELRQVDENKWKVTLYWVKLVAKNA